MVPVGDCILATGSVVMMSCDREKGRVKKVWGFKDNRWCRGRRVGLQDGGSRREGFL